MRLFIDDSCAFGVLGASGRGVVEHYDLDVSMDVDMIAASLEYGIAAYGGFCTGSYYIIDHQRLSGLGYCFSASLPPLQAAVALKSIDLIRREPERVLLVRERSTVMHSLLTTSSRSKYLTVYGSAVSPIKHLRFAVPIEQAMKSRQEPSARLKRANKSFYSFKERTCSELDTYRLEAVVNYVCFHLVLMTLPSNWFPLSLGTEKRAGSYRFSISGRRRAPYAWAEHSPNSVHLVYRKWTRRSGRSNSGSIPRSASTISSWSHLTVQSGLSWV